MNSTIKLKTTISIKITVKLTYILKEQVNGLKRRIKHKFDLKESVLNYQNNKHIDLYGLVRWCSLNLRLWIELIARF